MKQKANYVSVALLFALFLGFEANAQTAGERIYKRDVQPKRERVPNIINKLVYDEYAPAISPDGNTLVYQSNRTADDEGNIISPTWQKFLLWESRRDSTGFWAVPKPVAAINEMASGAEDEIGGPSISYDGSTLFFHAKVEGGKGGSDIYVSKRKKNDDGSWGEWEKAVAVSGSVNTDKEEAFPSISSDGARLYFTAYDAANDTTKTNRKGTQCYKLMVAKADANGVFGKAEELPTPVNGSCDKYVRVLPDNQTVIFSSTRGGGSPKDADDFDLFYSELQKGNEWAEPKATDMAPFVRTTMYSYQPDMLVSIAPHDKPHVLAYFSAYVGASHEIFTYPLPKEIGPKNICNFVGSVVDSADNKVLEANIAITNQTRTWLNHDKKTENGKFRTVLTEGNVYTFTVTKEGYKPYSFKADVTKMDEFTMCAKEIRLQKSGVAVNISVIDGVTEEAVEAPVTVADGSGKAQDGVVQQGAGKYTATLEPKAKYTATAAKTGDYEESKEEIDLTNAKSGDKVDVVIRMYNVPDVTFDNINFRTARPRTMVANELATSITEMPKSVTTLTQVKAFMTDYKMAKIRIEAHTDDRGNDNYNLGLSQRRAAAAKKWLVDNGIADDRLISEGFGEAKPLVPNDSDNNRSLNRRVEFKVGRK